MRRHGLLWVALGIACLLSACGASTRTEKHVVARPAARGLDRRGGVSLVYGHKDISPAEARRAMKEVEAFTRAHCPCTEEQTSTGPRLLSEQRP